MQKIILMLVLSISPDAHPYQKSKSYKSIVAQKLAQFPNAGFIFCFA